MKKILILFFLIVVSIATFSEDFMYFGKVKSVHFVPAEHVWANGYNEIRIMIERDDVVGPYNNYWYFYRVAPSDSDGLSKMKVFLSIALLAKANDETVVVGVSNVNVPSQAHGILTFIGENFPESGH